MYESYFTNLDALTTTSTLPAGDGLTLSEMNAKRDRLAPYAEFMVNEYLLRTVGHLPCLLPAACWVHL